MLPHQPNQSLIDGLACLQAVVGAEAPVGGRELARQLALESTRVNRLLKTLAHLGLTQQRPDRRYVAGPGIHVLAAQSLFASGLIRRALPVLESLHRHKLIVALGVLWRDQVSYLYHATPGMVAAEGLGRSGLFPASKSSIGMILLAQLPDRELRQRFPELGASLRATRKAGFARTQPNPGTESLAVAIGTPAFAAVALSGKITERQIPKLVASLDAAVAEIERKTPDE
jgi:DNA-binding IclR family transcriptional regulator